MYNFVIIFLTTDKRVDSFRKALGGGVLKIVKLLEIHPPKIYAWLIIKQIGKNPDV